MMDNVAISQPKIINKSLSLDLEEIALQPNSQTPNYRFGLSLVHPHSIPKMMEYRYGIHMVHPQLISESLNGELVPSTVPFESKCDIINNELQPDTVHSQLKSSMVNAAFVTEILPHQSNVKMVDDKLVETNIPPSNMKMTNDNILTNATPRSKTKIENITSIHPEPDNPMVDAEFAGNAFSRQSNPRMLNDVSYPTCISPQSNAEIADAEFFPKLSPFRKASIAQFESENSSIPDAEKVFMTDAEKSVINQHSKPTTLMESDIPPRAEITDTQYGQKKSFYSWC